jgi:hypothetical protein
VAVAKLTKSKAEVAKTAKLEAKKKKRKRGADPTSMAEDIEEKHEAIDSLSWDDLVRPRSLSPAMKQKWEEEVKMMEEDLRRIRKAQLAKAGVQAKMPTKVLGQLLKPKVHGKIAQKLDLRA